MEIEEKILQGAGIVINDWLQLPRRAKLLIVTNPEYIQEAKALEQCAEKRGATAHIMMMENRGIHAGVFFDRHPDIFDGYHTVIGATEYSLVTTEAVKRAISQGTKFLSLPLCTNDNVSILAYDFLGMDTQKSKNMARVIIGKIRDSSKITVTTALGTDLTLWKRGRNPGFFNGVVKDGKGYSSSSIEMYIPVEEDQTNGLLVVDGSLGYIGKVAQPIHLTLQKGRIAEIEEHAEGRRLREYLQSYGDPAMYIVGEFGIGLNTHAKCRGKCYIEDESSYGTCHFGLGRNLALGGRHAASGHFDLVILEPDIFVDNLQIMSRGQITITDGYPYP